MHRNPIETTAALVGKNNRKKLFPKPLELTYTQEQKLLRLAKRIKFDKAEIIKGAAGLVYDTMHPSGLWKDDTDWSEYPWRKQDAIITKVLGRPWTPTEHNERECSGCSSGYYICNREKDHDPLYCAAQKLIHETCFRRWQDAIFAYKEQVPA